MKKSKNSKVSKIPRFANEDEERDFWDNHDFTDYIDQYKKIKLDLSGLKPSTVPVTVRLPVSLVEDLKLLANKRDVPYQSLLKVFLSQKVKEEFLTK